MPAEKLRRARAGVIDRIPDLIGKVFGGPGPGRPDPVPVAARGAGFPGLGPRFGSTGRAATRS